MMQNRLLNSTLSLVFLLLAQTVFSQDKIYLQQSTKQGKVTKISQATIAYFPTSGSGQELSIPTQKVVLVFNQYGRYLMPAKVSFTTEAGTKELEVFLKDKTTLAKHDKIFLSDGKIFDAEIISEEAKTITYKIPGASTELKVNDVVLYIKKNGSHKILGSLEDAIVSLDRFSVSQIQGTQTNAIAAPAALSENSASRAPTIGEIVPGLTQEEVTEKAKQKTYQLSNYLTLLCDKKLQSNLPLIVDQAVSLFVNEDVLVQVSSVNNTDIRQITIRTYLNQLVLLTYDAVDIQWTKVQYVSSLIANPDGTYTGTVSFEQKFTGYMDGRIVYEDITRKEAQVILKTYMKTVEGQQKLNWDVLLSDVKVISTKKPAVKA